MQKRNTMYYKLMQQHNSKQDYFLLVSFASSITQRDAMSYDTLCAITPTMLESAVAKFELLYNAENSIDVTSASVAKMLQKHFKQQEQEAASYF